MNFVASFGNLFSGWDTFIILLIVLIIFGPKRLPGLARGVAEAINEFNKARDDMHRQISRIDQPVVQQPPNVQPRAAESAAAPQPAQPAAPASENPAQPQA